MLKLSFDVTSGALVVWEGSSAALPALRQGTVDVELRFVTPNSTFVPGGDFAGAEQYSTVDLTAYSGVRIGLWTNSTFTDADSASLLLALATDLTLNDDDDDDHYFTGRLNLSTTEIAALTGKVKACYLAISLVNPDLSFTTIYDHKNTTNATLYSATDDGFAAMPGSASATAPIRLPIRLLDVPSGEIFELTRTAPGVLTFVWTNP